MEEVLLCTKCEFLILDANIVPILGTAALNGSDLLILFSQLSLLGPVMK